MKQMKFSLFNLPAIGEQHFIEKKGFYAGQNRQLYQTLLRDLREQAQLVDDMGFHAWCCTEHHFHVEGYETSTNPIMLGLYIGMQTKYLKVGQLANVLPTHNPIRLAEDIAMLDQMTRGRAFAAFARGYQERWVRTMAQKNNVGISNSDPEENARNKQVYEEYYDIVRKAWAGGTFRHEGEWQIPVPVDYSYKDYQEGLDENKILREIGISPIPYQKEMDLWHPFSFTESTIRWCAQRGIQPVIIHTDPKVINKLYDAYHEEANEAGYNRKRGERIAQIRDVFVYDTEEEAKYWQSKGAGFIWNRWFSPDGFDASNLREGEELSQLTGEYDELVEREFCIVGTPDQVARQLDKLEQDTGCQHLVLYNFASAIPHDKIMRSLDLFTTKVMPYFVD
jgi:alkanesulfonate monooxygenase SsuD/methylene tetrahydromethanopterin reductase-like flavin-dependent oxidoreductase (luciferase family)